VDRRRKFVIVIIIGLVFLGIEVVTFPVISLVASPPNEQNEVTCSPGQQNGQCTFSLRLYQGAGSLSYCFLGYGAVYLRGVYYPLTQPQASHEREISGGLCPAMRP